MDVKKVYKEWITGRACLSVSSVRLPACLLAYLSTNFIFKSFNRLNAVPKERELMLEDVRPF
jgi:hypothetical protein